MRPEALGRPSREAGLWRDAVVCVEGSEGSEGLERPLKDTFEADNMNSACVEAKHHEEADVAHERQTR